jgi:hypothetical protein
MAKDFPSCVKRQSAVSKQPTTPHVALTTLVGKMPLVDVGS